MITAQTPDQACAQSKEKLAAYYDWLEAQYDSALASGAQNADSTQTLYGLRGWTLHTGVLRAILPFSALADKALLTTTEANPAGCEHQLVDFISICDLPPQTAAQLLGKLPAAAAQDRQNNAPTVGELLQLCAQNPFVTHLGGYLITALRDDERLSIDTVEVKLPLSSSTQLTASEATPWEKAKTLLGWQPQCSPPDEAFATGFQLSTQKYGPSWQTWRFWWD